jgi:hypothetical protein
MILLGITPAIRAQMRRFKDLACDLDAHLLTIESKDDFRNALAMAKELNLLRDVMIEASLISGSARAGRPPPILMCAKIRI